MLNALPDDELRPERESQTFDLGSLDKPTTIEWRRDNLREKLALRLTYAVITITVLPVASVVVFPDRAAAIRDVAALILPAVIGTYGAIIGFYFGGKK